ncbi:MAG: metallophosphoesterase [Clostridia bacterium]|nr:metallophosphoesterase [Clostridia bacterium]
MLSAFAAAVRFVMVAIMTVVTVIAPFSQKKEAKIARMNADCRAAFAAISDTHLKDNFIRLGMFEFGLQDLAQAQDRLDAFVIDGDITDCGDVENWEAVAKTLNKYDISNNNIMVLGNHDTWGGDRTPDYTRETFIKFTKDATGREIEQVYFTTEINGYPVIVLGSEGDNTSATISQTQIDWFADEMAKAAATGLPIFVFCHQPFNGTHGLPYSWEMNEDEDPDTGGIGDASDALLAIVEQYQNVIFISGHIHTGFTNKDSKYGFESVERHGSYTLVNLPCYEYPDVQRGGHINNGTGYVFEIYDGEILLRARNFATGTWLEEYNETIPVTPANPAA